MRFLVLAFALGICWCQQQAVLPALLPLLIITGVCGLCVALARRAGWPRLAWFAAMSMAVACGVGYADWRAGMRLAEGLPSQLEGQDFAVEGYIADLPDRGERGTRFLFRAKHRPAGVPEYLSLSWYADGTQAVPGLRAGEAWQLTVRLRRPHGNLNPHGFDFEGWMFERNIRAVGYVRSRDPNRRVEVIAYGIGPHIQHARQVVRERFERALPDGRWVGVLSALAVGDQSAVPTQQWRLFSQTGVTHLMSISGGHVTLFAALIAWLVRRAWSRSPRPCLRLPAQKAAIAAGAVAAIFYVVLSGFGVPAQRTLYMLLVAAAGIWFGRGVSAARCLSAALFVVLLYDPWAVLSPGFWLSFGAVAVLFWIGGGLLTRGERSVWSWLQAQLRAQWAIILLTLPILLGLFQQFSLVSPLANALAIPLVSAVITPLALLFALLPLPSLAEFAHWLLSWLMRFLEWLASLPMANWQQAAPPAWLIAIGVLAAFWALVPRGFPARRTALLAFLPLIFWTPLRPAVGHFDAAVIDVGQGLAVHVQTAAHDLLFDTGPQYTPESDSGERVIHPYLRAAGVQRLDRMIVSHDDLDHSGGAASLLKLIPIASFMSSLPDEHALVRQAGGQRPCARGDAWDWDGVHFEVLHPADASATKDNDRSCVLRVSDVRWSLLLTADIEAPSERAILARDAARLHSTVLVAPHHGSKTSSGQAFIDAVGARTVIFTSGYRNRFHHPAPEVVERYAATGALLLRSDLDGAVIMEEGPERGGTTEGSTGPQIARERQVRARYWQGK